MKIHLILVLLTIILNFLNVQSIYFLFTKGVEKCFYDEYYEGNIITLKINTLEDFHEMDNQEHEHVAIFSITLKNLSSEKEDEFQGISTNSKVKFIIEKSAQYSICITANQDVRIFENKEVLKISVFLETIEEKSREIDLSNVPKSEDFKKINTKIDKVHSKVIDVLKSQHYQINKEEEFIDQQTENSNIIMYLTGIQICILLVLTIWQIISFKNLFKDQLNSVL
jgi:hypothetical protein